MPFPKDQAGINQLLQAWIANEGILKTIFGLSVEQIDEIQSMAGVYNTAFDYFPQFDAFVDAVRKFKSAIRTGFAADEAAPTFPAFTNFAPPAALIFDIEGKAKEYRRFFRNHPNRTQSILELLLIADSDTPPAPDSNAEPVINATNIGNYSAENTFKKGKFAGVRFEWREQGTVKWNSGTVGIGSPTILTISAPADGKPITIEIRAIYVDGKNNPIGNWSQIEIVTLTLST